MKFGWKRNKNQNINYINFVFCLYISFIEITYVKYEK